MPYRRLPNTDISRLRALETALEKIKGKSPSDVAFSQKSYAALKTVLSTFRDTITQHKNNVLDYNKKNKIHLTNAKKARMYVSHFIQVVDMAIARGDQSTNIRSFYGLNPHDAKLPPLKTDKDIFKWGNQVIEGEMLRIRQGNSPIMNPTIAMVKINYEKFLDTFRFQETVKKSYDRSHQLMNNQRTVVDKLIQNIWNEVEASHAHLGDDKKRELSTEYGVSYVIRKSEMLKLSGEGENTSEETVRSTAKKSRQVKKKSDILEFRLF